MDLSRALGAVLRYWWLLALCGLLAAGVAYAVSSTLPREYEADTALLVGSLTTTDPTEHQGYRELSQTYALLVNTPLVLDSVAEQLGLDDVAARDLGARIEARSTEGQSLVLITATAPIPEEAALTARAVASTLATLSQGEDLGSTTLATVVQEAQTPDAPSSPRVALNTGLGAAVGVLFAIVLVLVWAERKERHRAAAAPRYPPQGAPYAAPGPPGRIPRP